MSHTIKFLFKAIFKFVLYVGSSFFLMLVVSSLLSGKFPPPFKEYYQQTKNFGKDFSSNTKKEGALPDLSSSLKAISESRKQQAALLQDLNQEQASAAEKSIQSSGEANNIAAIAAKRIKELEYEVAFYKAKLARSEWERNQLLKSRSPSAAATPSNTTTSKR